MTLTLRQVCSGALYIFMLAASALSVLFFWCVVGSLPPSNYEGHVHGAMWVVVATFFCYLLSGYATLACLFVMPWFYNWPHPVHFASFGETFGKIGYDTLTEYAIELLFGGLFLALYTAYMVVVDRSLPAGPPAASISVFHTITYAILHFLSIFWGMYTSHVTWHAWHSGLQVGRALFSPDTADTTIVSFVQDRMHDHPIVTPEGPPREPRVRRHSSDTLPTLL